MHKRATGKGQLFQLSYIYDWVVKCPWFSLGPPVSATNKTDRHDITEILLKVALSIIFFQMSTAIYQWDRSFNLWYINGWHFYKPMQLPYVKDKLFCKSNMIRWKIASHLINFITYNTILIIDEKKIAAISVEIVKMYLLPLTKPLTLQVLYFLFKNIVTNFCDRNRPMLNLCMLN